MAQQQDKNAPAGGSDATNPNANPQQTQQNNRSSMGLMMILLLALIAILIAVLTGGIGLAVGLPIMAGLAGAAAGVGMGNMLSNRSGQSATPNMAGSPGNSVPFGYGGLEMGPDGLSPTVGVGIPLGGERPSNQQPSTQHSQVRHAQNQQQSTTEAHQSRQIPGGVELQQSQTREVEMQPLGNHKKVLEEALSVEGKESQQTNAASTVPHMKSPKDMEQQTKAPAPAPGNRSQ